MRVLSNARWSAFALLSLAASSPPALTVPGGEEAKLLPVDGAPGKLFGARVALHGTAAVLGARGDNQNGPGAGAAYLFDLTTGRQTAKLTPHDAQAGQLFGAGVAVRGTRAVLGAPGDDEGAATAGAAYVFDVTTGQQLLKLIPADPSTGELFGSAVALSGTTAILGAAYDGENGVRAGAAYLFDVATGQQLAKLLPLDGAPGQEFGSSVGG